MAKKYPIRVECPHCELSIVDSVPNLEGSRIMKCKGAMSNRGCGEMFAIDWKHVPKVKIYAITKA